MQIDSGIVICLIAILGAMTGSFIGAMTWRMRKGLDWVRDRSRCESCRHVLSVGDLVPVVSYVGLRGKCRYCREPIGRVTFLIETMMLLVFALSALIWPSAIAMHATTFEAMLHYGGMWMSVGFGLWLIIVGFMGALFVYDARWKILPNKFVFPLIAIAIIYSAVIAFGVQNQPWLNWLGDHIIATLCISGVYAVLYYISDGRWIGFGDVKLGLALGWLLPWWGGLAVLLISNILGTVFALPGLIGKKYGLKSQIPFGPFLIAATVITVLFGWQMVMIFQT